jgi:hypothetical protein
LDSHFCFGEESKMVRPFDAEASHLTPRQAADLRWLLFSAELFALPSNGATVDATSERSRASETTEKPKSLEPVEAFRLSQEETHQAETWIASCTYMLTSATKLAEGAQTPFAPKPRTRFTLGRYAEDLLEYYFQWGPTHRLVAARTQVSSEGRSLGEIDFLVIRVRDERLLHIELATKFFLEMGGTYIGPNGKELLVHKWQRFFAHQLQLPLGHHLGATRVAMSRGRIFYRPKDGRTLVSTQSSSVVSVNGALHTQVLAPEHIRSIWLYVDEIPPWPYRGRALRKEEWLARISAMEVEPLTQGFVASQVEAHQTKGTGTTRELAKKPAEPRALAFVAIDARGHEVFRFFAVPRG